MSLSVLQRLHDPQLIALCVSGDAWPRGLIAQSLIPDTWMGLLRRRDGRRRFVPAGDDPRAERDDSLLLVRNRAFQTPFSIGETAAADGHFVKGSGDVLLRWTPAETDLAALAESLRGTNELRLADLQRWFAEAGGIAAVRAFVNAHPAAELIESDTRAALLAALRESLKRWLFQTGLTIEQVTRFSLESHGFRQHLARERERQQHLEQIRSRELVEQAALEATQRRLADLSGIFDKLRAAAGANGDMQWHELLPSLSPAERGRLLENLWRLTPDQKQTAAIVAVGGDEVIWLDPASPDEVVRRVQLGLELGGLRSVSFDARSDSLLVGAATGIWRLKANSGELLARYAVPNAGAPRTGFNAAVIAGENLFATHSQLGCWMWPGAVEEFSSSADASAGARPLLKPQNGLPRAIRSVCRLDGERVAFAADDAVCIFSSPGDELLRIPAPGQEFLGLRACGARLFGGTSAGLVLECDVDAAAPAWRTLLQTAGPLESIQPRRWNDLVEVVVPAGPAGINGIYGDEGTVTRLVATPTPIRRAWAADDVVVGLNERRDKLVIATANMPERSGREVPLARLMGASIQDVCLVTATVPRVAT